MYALIMQNGYNENFFSAELEGHLVRALTYLVLGLQESRSDDAEDLNDNG